MKILSVYAETGVSWGSWVECAMSPAPDITREIFFLFISVLLSLSDVLSSRGGPARTPQEATADHSAPAR